MSRMPLVSFQPLGVKTSQVGFGCGTLVGRATFREAARLVETALDLGIRYFDAAPNYGMGTAEEVLGAVLGDAPDVVIATKVGYPRAGYSARANLVRKWLKPWLDRSRGIKTLARRLYARRPATPAAPRGHGPDVFTAANVRESLAQSLSLLRRSRVDVFLAHDPAASALTAATADVFEAALGEGLVGAYGAAMSGATPPADGFGSVWQSAWPRDPAADYPAGPVYIHHGVIRTAEKHRSGATKRPARTLLREAIATQPGAIFLVATSTPAKLRDICSELD